MEQKNNFPDENKKRAAFKRFSQMSAAGLAVLSLSAFTDLSAKQLPAIVDNNIVKEQNLQFAKLSDNPFAVDENLLNYADVPDQVPYYDAYSRYNNYYGNYYNYSVYYSNQYSNYCNSTT